MRVVGTAGHVDHGKSTLIAALTGIHPDRLKEEKAREMTIDLGFAWLTLPGGEPVGIVDVPGHRDFIENMLAGVGGVDAVLFVIAADEGIMPQTNLRMALPQRSLSGPAATSGPEYGLRAFMAAIGAALIALPMVFGASRVL